MKNEITLTEEKRNELVLNILTDAVIFEKTTNAVNLLQKVGNPNAEDWEAEYQFSGLSNAYYLMGVPAYESFENEQKYLPIVDVLFKIFHNAISAEEKRVDKIKRMPKDIAKEILDEWKGFLDNTNLGMQKAG